MQFGPALQRLQHVSAFHCRKYRYYTSIMCSLQNDQQYLVLECVAEERNRMLMVYIDNIRIKSPPPPPTASNPSDRVIKYLLSFSIACRAVSVNAY